MFEIKIRRIKAKFNYLFVLFPQDSMILNCRLPNIYQVYSDKTEPLLGLRMAKKFVKNFSYLLCSLNSAIYQNYSLFYKVLTF